MYKNILIVLTYLVYIISAKNVSFLSNTKRAKIFELTDNEIPVFKITLPEYEYKCLKEEIQRISDPIATENINIEDFQSSNNTSTILNINEEEEPGFPSFISENLPTNKNSSESFKTKNGSLSVEINGEKLNFNKVTFSLGGTSSRVFARQGFNIKIGDKKDLYGRKNFKIRPDAREATYLRSKLTCDIHNRLGLPSISANYITLYLNDEYMGLYVLMDSIKTSWIEFVYGDENTTSLYKCNMVNNFLTYESSSAGCINENKDVTDNSELETFLKALDNAKSAEDIEDIFDIDLFLKEMAFEYLSGSWDHYLIFAHNFFLYKPKNDKWKFLLYDFDSEFGQDIGSRYFIPGKAIEKVDFLNLSFKQWSKPRHLLDILIFNNSTRFNNILSNIVTDVFNPGTLFPRINELKTFIKPYVEKDKTPDSNGKYPGRINEGINDYTLEQWDSNIEFTDIDTIQHSQAYGLKKWILGKYRYVCKNYTISCDQKYLDQNYDIKESYVSSSINNIYKFKQGFIITFIICLFYIYF